MAVLAGGRLTNCNGSASVCRASDGIAGELTPKLTDLEADVRDRQ
jgi:hypothetical protein